MRWIARLLLFLVLLVSGVVALLAVVPTRWIADAIESEFAERFALDLDIGELGLNPWSLTPGVRLQSLSLAAGKPANSTAAAGTDAANDAQRPDAPLLDAIDLVLAVDLTALVQGNVVIDRIAAGGGTVRLVTDEAGRANWHPVLDAFADANSDAGADEPAENNGTLPAIRDLRLDDVRIEYIDRSTDRTASLSVSADGSTIDDSRPTRVDIDGEVQKVPLSINGTVSPLQVIGTSPMELTVDLDAELGETVVTVDGSVGELTSLAEPKLNFSLRAPDLEDVANAAQVSLPSLPRFSLAGKIRRDGDEWIMRRFDGSLGENMLAGDIRLDPTTEPLTLYANLIAERLDLDELADVLGAARDEEESSGASAADDAALRDNPVSAEQSLLPDTPLDLEPLIQAFNGAIRFRAPDIRSSDWPLDSVEMRLEISASELALSPLKLAIAGGEISGGVDLDVSTDPPTGTIDLRVRQIDLRQIMQSVGVDDDSFGVIGGRSKFWITGNSIARMAASTDGGIFLLMTGGKLDALLAELAGLDVLESTALLIDPGKTLTPIDCAYLDLHAEGGLLEINRLVFDTRDTLFLADGSVDLAEERFEVTIEPHPKDVSVLGSDTAVTLSGTPGDIDITPGAALPLRAAAAAVLGTLAAPVAALLPLLQPGLTEGSPYCDGLIDSLDDAR